MTQKSCHISFQYFAGATDIALAVSSHHVCLAAPAEADSFWSVRGVENAVSVASGLSLAVVFFSSTAQCVF